MTTSELASIAIEGVNTILPELTETTDTLNAIFKDNGRAVKVGQIAYRLPMDVAEVGTVQVVNLDAATGLPRGGAVAYDKGNVTPMAWAIPVEWTLLTQLQGTTADNLAVQNVVKRIMASQAKMINTWRDVGYHTDGTGNIGTLSSTPSSSVLTMNGGFGARLLRKGQKVDIYNGTARRGYHAIDYVINSLGAAQKYHYSSAQDDGGTGIAGATSGDIVRIAGVTDGAPVWIHGLPYFVNTSTAGSLMGITKLTAPWTVSNGYDMGNAQISLPALRLIEAQVKGRLGPDALKNQFFYTHTSQVAAYEELGFELQSVRSDGKFGDLDLLFKGKKSAGGYPIVEGIHADQTAWYFLNPANWGKARYGNPPFFFEGTGSKIAPVYDTTTGTPTPMLGSWLIDSFQAYCDNVLTQGVITTCKVPVGHIA